MVFESRFGGFAGWKSVPAAMGGEPSFAGTSANGEVAPVAAIRRTTPSYQEATKADTL